MFKNDVQITSSKPYLLFSAIQRDTICLLDLKCVWSCLTTCVTGVWRRWFPRRCEQIDPLGQQTLPHTGVLTQIVHFDFSVQGKKQMTFQVLSR